MEDKINETKIDKSLITLIIDSILGMEDINDISCYKFDMILCDTRLKGVVKVEFEEVE